MRQPDYDVAVVGGGPVGVTLLNLLGRYGLRAVGFEREASAGHSPRAGSFDGEAMRVFQAAGLAEQITSVVTPGVGVRLVNGQGDTLLEIDHRGRDGAQGWAVSYRMHQPTVEQILRDGLRRFDAVDFHPAHEVVALHQDDDAVVLDIVDRATGATRQATARHAIGCDGASSSVRKQLGSRVESIGTDQPYLVVDARATRTLDLPQEGVLYCWPSRPQYWRGLLPWLRWELKVMPGDDLDEIRTPAGVLRLLEQWVTPDQIEIERAVVYTFHSLVVDPWRSGNVLLAGDAAHVQPPFMGQGLCSGLRDAANLAWKLALVCEGAADDGLLDSYQVERGPHARAWIEEATRIGAIVTTTDRAAAAERDARILAGSRELRTIVPPLGPGLHGSAPEPAGTLSVQPVLPDGRRLDDVVGLRFLVAARTDVLEAMPACVRHALEDSDRFSVMTGPVIGPYLDSYGCDAVVVRPDRYVLGAADDADGLLRVLERVPGTPAFSAT